MTPRNPADRPATEPIETALGTLRLVEVDGIPTFKLKCPGCGVWGALDEDQLRGRVSVDHTDTGCTYHETHDFADAVLSAEAGCGGFTDAR